MTLYKFWDFDKRCFNETTQVLQMSASDMTEAKKCEYRLHYKFQKIIKPVKNIYLIMGSIFHSVTENNLKYNAKMGVDQSWVNLKVYFESEWKKQIQGITDFGKYSEQQAKNICLNYVKVYHIKMSPFLYPLNPDSIEKFFRVYVTYEGKRLGITGKIDMIGRDLYVIDHKTSSSQWSQQQADDEIQGQLYPFCTKKLGYDVKGFKFNVVSGDSVIPYEVKYDIKKLKEILINAFAVKDRIENNAMLRSKSEKNCKWCEYNSVCKVKLCQ
jgi:CRISPR/Cas system-associated exonuclease Cas4 (RecB family)